MRAAQQRLFADAQPLVERLGRDFFLQVPRRPGVYLMRDDREVVLYVGKARNLRQRLAAYRVANPDRMPRRLLRLVHQVCAIECELCVDEAAALVREAELLRSLKPRFNRAGTWSVPPRKIAWRLTQSALEFQFGDDLEAGMPGISAHAVRGGRFTWQVLVRAVWAVLNPHRSIHEMPPGWFAGAAATRLAIPIPEPARAELNQASQCIDLLLRGDPATFLDWARRRHAPDMHPFERAARDADLEHLEQLRSVAT